jgi:hypothetical protein
VEQRTVGQAGEAVVERHVDELFLGVLAVADLVDVHDDAADVGILQEVHRPDGQPRLRTIRSRQPHLTLEHLAR